MREDVMGSESVLQQRRLLAGEPELLPRAVAGSFASVVVVHVAVSPHRPGFLAMLPRHSSGTNSTALRSLPLRARRRRFIFWRW